MGSEPDTYLYSEQYDLLKRALEKANVFEAPGLRIFCFWRIKNQEKIFNLIIEHLEKAVEMAEKYNVLLFLENEYACTIGTAEEAMKVFDAVDSPYLKILWDPGNAYFVGEKPYPDGYSLLDKSRIYHIHLKDASYDSKNKKYIWLPIGKGEIDYLGQFKTLLEDEYDRTLSLETHYRIPGKPEADASRESMNGIVEIIKKI